MTRLPSPPAFVLIALAWLAVGCGDSDPGPPPQGGEALTTARPRTIVLISLDTLRPERLGAYGGRPEVSPVIDALAAESVVFDTALAPAPWTLPSHMTMLTGLDPIAHGVMNDGMQLSQSAQTLASRLSAAGYATGAFTDGGFVSARYGFDRGFDVFDDERANKGPNGFPRLMPEALDWLDDQDDDVFLFLHTFDAHAPYDEVDPEILAEFRERPVEPDPRDAGMHWLGYLHKQVKVGVKNYSRMGHLLNDYDAGIHEADRYLGQLFDALRAAGRWDDALIIVTSDHGESFLDHGLHVGHGLLLNDSELLVPLIMRLPGAVGAGKRFDDLVGLVDIPRTVMELVGLGTDADLQGESLMGLVNGFQRSVDFILGWSQNTRSFTLVTEDYKYISPVGLKPMMIAQRHLGPMTPPGYFPVEDDMKYELGDEQLGYDSKRDPLGLLDVLPASEQMFDRRTDRGELRNLADLDPVKTKVIRDAAKLRFGKSQQLNQKYPTGVVTEDQFTEAVLKSLGYLGTGDETELQGTSRQFRDWALEARDVPDTRQLYRADVRVHEQRILLASSDSDRSEIADKLKGAAIDYDTWAKNNPMYAPRVYWRLAEVVRLADLAEVTFTSPDWLAKAQQDQP